MERMKITARDALDDVIGDLRKLVELLVAAPDLQGGNDKAIATLAVAAGRLTTLSVRKGRALEAIEWPTDELPPLGTGPLELTCSERPGAYIHPPPPAEQATVQTGDAPAEWKAGRAGWTDPSPEGFVAQSVVVSSDQVIPAEVRVEQRCEATMEGIQCEKGAGHEGPHGAQVSISRNPDYFPFDDDIPF